MRWKPSPGLTRVVCLPQNTLGLRIWRCVRVPVFNIGTGLAGQAHHYMQERGANSGGGGS